MNKLHHPTPNQEKIIRQILNHGFTCAPAVQVAFLWSAPAAHGSLGRLLERGWLWAFRLWPGVSGYRLTSRACAELEISPSHSRPLGDQGLVARTALLMDAVRRSVAPFNAGDLAARWPGLERFVGQRFQPGETVPVVTTYVDHGALPARIPAKTNALYFRLARVAEAARHVRDGSLGVRVLTGTPGKAEAIARAFASAKSSAPWPTEIEVVPEIANCLIGGLR